MLGLDLCSETVVGSDMHRGVSGGQKKRVTTGPSLFFYLIAFVPIRKFFKGILSSLSGTHNNNRRAYNMQEK